MLLLASFHSSMSVFHQNECSFRDKRDHVIIAGHITLNFLKATGPFSNISSHVVVSRIQLF